MEALDQKEPRPEAEGELGEYRILKMIILRSATHIPCLLCCICSNVEGNTIVDAHSVYRVNKQVVGGIGDWERLLLESYQSGWLYF